jgi:hypothetical protein
MAANQGEGDAVPSNLGIYPNLLWKISDTGNTPLNLDVYQVGSDCVVDK